jgi:hypothetical protein
VSFAVGTALAFGVVNVWMLFVLHAADGASNVIDRRRAHHGIRSRAARRRV